QGHHLVECFGDVLRRAPCESTGRCRCRRRGRSGFRFRRTTRSPPRGTIGLADKLFEGTVADCPASALGSPIRAITMRRSRRSRWPESAEGLADRLAAVDDEEHRYVGTKDEARSRNPGRSSRTALGTPPSCTRGTRPSPRSEEHTSELQSL